MELTYKTVGKMAERWDWEIASEYGEPGYDMPYGASDGAGIILGDYWCRCGTVLREDGSPNLHDVFHHYPRLGVALEEQGWQLEWDDEWVVDWENGGKCYRISGDSYSWQPSLIITEYGDFLTPDDDVEEWVAEMGNDPHRCITARAKSTSDLEAAGFVRWEPDDPHTYESGWHPGQTDDPESITREIREATGLDEDELTIVFYLNSSGQFDVRFSAWTRDERDRNGD